MITPCAIARWWLHTLGDIIERGARHLVLSTATTPQDREELAELIDEINRQRGHPT